MQITRLNQHARNPNLFYYITALKQLQENDVLKSQFLSVYSDRLVNDRIYPGDNPGNLPVDPFGSVRFILFIMTGGIKGYRCHGPIPFCNPLVKGQSVEYRQLAVKFFFLRFGELSLLFVHNLFCGDPLVKPLQGVKGRKEFCSPRTGHFRVADPEMGVFIMFRASVQENLPVGKSLWHGHGTDGRV